MEFYLSGYVLITLDPINVYMENIYIDMWEKVGMMDFLPNCNYPEAYITPTVYINNLTAGYSSDEPSSFVPNVFYYSGPGNITALNVNITNAFGLTTLALATFVVTVESTCTPDDGLIKTYDFHSVHISLKDNAFGSKMNVFVVN